MSDVNLGLRMVLRKLEKTAMSLGYGKMRELLIQGQEIQDRIFWEQSDRQGVEWDRVMEQVPRLPSCSPNIKE